MSTHKHTQTFTVALCIAKSKIYMYVLKCVQCGVSQNETVYSTEKELTANTTHSNTGESQKYSK